MARRPARLPAGQGAQRLSPGEAPASSTADGPIAPPVGVVVVNWHGRADTLDCLRALRAQTYPAVSLTLVDNGCADFSPAAAAELFPAARYLRTARNCGFAGGANLGMGDALAHGAAWVWFLNNDAQPEPPALAALVDAARRRPEWAIVGPKILQQADPRRLDSIAVRVDLRWGRLSLLGHDEPDHGQYDDLAAVDAVSGCAMLVRHDVCQSLGGFAEDFFAYVEDVDLCLRAAAAGWRTGVAPQARVLHRRAPATRGRQSPSSLYYAARNHLRLMQRHSPSRGRALSAIVTARNLAYAARGDGARFKRLRAVWRGVRDYRRNISGPAPDQ